MTSRSRAQEREYYEPVQHCLRGLLSESFPSHHLEITADRGFSNQIKAEVRSGRDIVFNFLRETRPDIAGFVQEQYSTEFVVVEVKAQNLVLDHIYQARRYAELLDAKYALLVTTEEIPEEIKRLSQVVYSLLSYSGSRRLSLVRFDPDAGAFVDWFPANPFATLT